MLHAEASLVEGDHSCHWQQCPNNTFISKIRSCFTDIKSSGASVKWGNVMDWVGSRLMSAPRAQPGSPCPHRDCDFPSKSTTSELLWDPTLQLAGDGT